MRDVSARSAFLVDSGGTVRDAWLYGPSELPDLDVLLEAARVLYASARSPLLPLLGIADMLMKPFG